MAEYGNDPSSVRALGIDVGSTHVKAVVAEFRAQSVRELATSQQPVREGDAAGVVAAALAAVGSAVQAAGPVAVAGIASMAESGALVDDRGRPRGRLVRWDRSGDVRERLARGRGIDPVELHERTGAPMTPKLPLLAWAELASRTDAARLRWAFVADLIGAALTGRVATDHTLAGRSGAYPLPPAGTPLGTAWDAGLLAAVGAPVGMVPEILSIGEPLGVVGSGGVAGLSRGVPVYIAGHDHAVAARLAGVDRPGVVVHSLGTTEAVLASAPGAVDRPAAGRAGMSVVRDAGGEHEGVLAGNPAAGALVADWRRRAPEGTDVAEGRAGPAPLALPYPRGRQCPDPDPRARYVLQGTDGRDPGDELHAILRGLAAHGAWMRAEVTRLTGSESHPVVRAAGTPVRANRVLAGLMAALSGAPLPVVDLAAPVAVGAAALAAERAGLVPRIDPPYLVAGPDDDGVPDLAGRFAAAVAASALPEGIR